LDQLQLLGLKRSYILEQTATVKVRLFIRCSSEDQSEVLQTSDVKMWLTMHLSVILVIRLEYGR
jgi:hypothetical protein